MADFKLFKRLKCCWVAACTVSATYANAQDYRNRAILASTPKSFLYEAQAL